MSMTVRCDVCSGEPGYELWLDGKLLACHLTKEDAEKIAALWNLFEPQITVGDIKLGTSYVINNEEFIRVAVPDRGWYGLSKADWNIYYQIDDTPCERVR